MYPDHFGLAEFPFSITPNTQFFFASKSSQEALNTLLVAVSMGEGFMKVTSEVGTGKTTLCRKLLASLGDGYVVAYPYLELLALFHAVAVELGLPRPLPRMPMSQHDVLHKLTRRVLDLNEDGKRVVICLDEVQAMPLKTLEALRLLTNLKIEQHKLLQVIIFGQPELEERLNHPSVRQLRQRITFHHRLAPLSKSEFSYYLQHGLAAAGYVRGELFTTSVLWLLRRRSRCVPRVINILAHKALISALGRGQRLVGWRDMMSAAHDTDALDKWHATQTVLGIAGVAVGLGLAMTYFWRYGTT
jgi:MSHA biogenesis protein MshM